MEDCSLTLFVSYIAITCWNWAHPSLLMRFQEPYSTFARTAYQVPVAKSIQSTSSLLVAHKNDI